MKFYKCINHLGVVFDLVYSWIFHFDLFQGNVNNVSYKLHRVSAATLKDRPLISKGVQLSVDENIVRYAVRILHLDFPEDTLVFREVYCSAPPHLMVQSQPKH